jgi:hypothetical protein
MANWEELASLCSGVYRFPGSGADTFLSFSLMGVRLIINF